MTEKAIVVNYVTKRKITLAIKELYPRYRHQVFLLAYATNGGSQKEAMKEAGYSEGSSHIISELTNSDKFQEALSIVRDIIAQEAEKSLVTKDQLLQLWTEIAFFKEKARDSDRIKASELIAKYLLMFPKEGESGGNTFVNINLTPEEKRDFFVQAVQKIAPAFTKNQKSEEEILEMKKKWGLQTYQPPAENGL